jgi:hypothetical protein
MIRRYLIEIALGLFFAAVIVIAQYGTTSATSTFIYQGF